MRAITPGVPHDYVPKCDRELPEAEQTVFSVSFLESEEVAKLRDGMYYEGGMGKRRRVAMKTGTFDQETLKKGLRGWRGLLDEEGNPVEFDQSKIVKMIDRIPPEVRTELAMHIRGDRDEEEE